MNKAEVMNAIAAHGVPVVRHVKTGNIYYLKMLIKSKSNGLWHESALYYGRSGSFSRLLDDFRGFDHLYNEVLVP